MHWKLLDLTDFISLNNLAVLEDKSSKPKIEKRGRGRFMNNCSNSVPYKGTKTRMTSHGGLVLVIRNRFLLSRRTAMGMPPPYQKIVTTSLYTSRIIIHRNGNTYKNNSDVFTKRSASVTFVARDIDPESGIPYVGSLTDNAVCDAYVCNKNIILSYILLVAWWINTFIMLVLNTLGVQG